MNNFKRFWSIFQNFLTNFVKEFKMKNLMIEFINLMELKK